MKKIILILLILHPSSFILLFAGPFINLDFE